MCAYDPNASSAIISQPPLVNAEAAALLGSILADAGKSNRNIVVFDLDSTLLDNRPRQALILREYGTDNDLAALASAHGDHWHGWDARIAMTNGGLTEAQVEEHFEGFRDYWRDRFFTSKYCAVDVPIAGAAHYVQAVAKTGAVIAYVTGRHEAMREGTIESFGPGGFPTQDDDRVHLLMKPTLEEHDDDYKDRTYGALRAIGSVVAAFDNEPTHINGYKTAFPQAQSVHMATDYSLRNIRVSDGIPSIADFADYASVT